MMAHSTGLQLSADTGGGILKGLKRSFLSGESFFVTTATASPQGGWVDVAALLPGDLMELEIHPHRPFFVTRGCWIANSYGTQLDTQWGGFSNLFGGEGGFGLHASGQGQVLLSVYGALDVIDLEPGQSVVVDTGHVVAYDLAIPFQLRRAVAGRSIQSFTSGEGLVFDFAGPGRIYLQSRNPDAFRQWVASLAPREQPRATAISNLLN